MGGDYSRQRFSPLSDFSSVLMQQGRVQLDSDWNELAAIHDRRTRAGTLDILGRAVVPAETKDAFLITPSGADFTIGAGRIYVDGILAENHGVQPGPFDPVLAEVGMGAAIPYNAQPWFGQTAAIPALPAGGPHLIYLDVWQREVTNSQAPEIVENAVGVDTTTRMQTVWQVRALPNIGASVTCATKDEDIPGWSALIAQSAGRLTTDYVPVPDDDSLCLLPPDKGYLGLENRLYRIEIHDGGPLGTATFKWSRDNASFVSAVTALPKPNQAVVWSLGKDATIAFQKGDWVEITDDIHELDGKPGIMAQIDSIDDAARQITFTAPLPAGAFPTSATGETTPALHTRMIRWDQNGEVRDANDNVVVDLSQTASNGVIPIPAAGTPIILEQGIQVTFSVDPAGGSFHRLDYWTTAARTADASIDILVAAPPRGVHHHYCRLAIVTLPGSAIDCRTIWPPDFGGDCQCTVCIHPADGPDAIQEAIDTYREDGATICLAPGVFELGDRPIFIGKARRLSIKGHTRRTELAYHGPDSLITIDTSESIELENLTLQWTVNVDRLGPAIDVRNCNDLEIHHCDILQLADQMDLRVPAIGLSDQLSSASFHHNRIRADTGIANISPNHIDGGAQPNQGEWDPGNPLLTTHLRIEHNIFDCRNRAISLETACFHRGETVLSENIVWGCDQGAIASRGAGLDERAVVTIGANAIETRGPGIIAGFPDTRIESNMVTIQRGAKAPGIVLVASNPDIRANIWVIGNRISGFLDAAVATFGDLGVLLIKQNIADHNGSGVLMDWKSSATEISIENNDFRDMKWPEQREGELPCVIRTIRCGRAEIASNLIDRFEAQRPPCGILNIGITDSASILRNRLANIMRPEGSTDPMGGIVVDGPFGDLDISGNHVEWDIAENDNEERWAILILGERGEIEHKIKIGNAHFITLEAETLALFGGVALRAPLNKGAITMLGNELESDTLSRTVRAQTRGACVFANNICTMSRFPEVTSVELTSDDLAVSANVLTGSMRMELQAGVWTVLGNITGGIWVNGAPLPAPWDQMNRI